MFELAKLYRDSGDLATADARATQGLAASQRVGDRYYVPRNLTILADLKARRGRIAEAKALYKHAEDVIDGMLGGDDSYWNSSIAAAMSQTYLQHFELVAKEADTAGAFQILERVRGRTLASALEDRNADPQSGSTEAATLDSYVATTQTRLMQTNSPVEREQLLDALAEYEWRSAVGVEPGRSALSHRPRTANPGSRQPEVRRSATGVRTRRAELLLYFGYAHDRKPASAAGWPQANRKTGPAVR